MFNFLAKSPNEPPLDNQDNQNNKNILLESDIHVMPKRQIMEKKAKGAIPYPEGGAVPEKPKPAKKPQSINWLILGILLFIVLAAVITTIIIFYSISYRNQQNAQLPNINNQDLANQPRLDENQNVNNANININQNLNQGLATAVTRDQQRIDDITSIRTALEQYFSENNQYPDNLGQLLNNYLTAMPQNPTPGGREYTYSVQDQKTNYQILFSLEEGATYGTLNLTQGDYQATSQGISLIITTPTDNNLNVNISPFPPITPSQPQTAVDSDNDYLTDLEENFYQTDPQNPDQDQDSYLDGVEVRNLYNPLAAESRLIDSGLVETFTNNNYNYTILYLKSWVANALAADYREVMITSSLGEFVSILIQDNPLGLTSLNWYLQYVPNIDPAALETLTIAGLPAVKSIDGLNTYLAVGNKIYIISYNIGNNQEKVFETTYKMMLKSFTLTNLTP